MRGFTIAAAVSAMLLVSCAGNPQPTAPTTETPADPTRGALAFDDPKTIATGLEVPWGLAFVDERTILVTERPGRVRLVVDGELQEGPVARIRVSASGEGGLLGVALHPQFPDQRLAFAYHTTAGGNRVSRYRLDEDFTFRGEHIILDGIPAAPVHDGGGIAVGPDGMLYVATGDAGDPQRAADLDSLGGKILRVTPDGEVPDDNPFGDSPVLSYGHRNPQGLAWDAEGRLYASEHGPSGEFGLCCHDEINLIRPGGFYGWPFRAGPVHAMDGEPPDDPVEPVASSGDDTWAPAGAVVHPSEGLLVATLAGQALLRFAVRAGGRRLEAAEPALGGFGRLRAALLGPDGCLYLTTSNTDGRGDPTPEDDRLVRVCTRGR